MGLIIFDFDGTIADSLEILIIAANRIAPEYGYPPISMEQIPEFKKLSSREIMRYLGLARWRLPFFLQRFRHELTQSMGDLQFIEGMKEVLLKLHQQGHRLGIVSSNSQQNVERFLQIQGCADWFEFVYGGQIFSSKARELSRLVRLNQDRERAIVFVGDETRDVQAAKQAGVKNIAVSWGLNARENLVRSQPDVLIDRPGELWAVVGE
ncbi:MAG: HAD-IA family hydrolase [Oculatellaceae cyanobacterium Prado106]|jgi:HAD superfamily hydrolase (TIGR01549 family)|nr:HAD-IA family hydrolase [Oculatellaceae cyanobacterium Prado106]